MIFNNVLNIIIMSWIAVGVAVVGAGVKIYSGIKQNKEAKKIHPTMNATSESPYAKEQLATAKQLFNSQMPGTADEMRGIANAQSNFNQNVQRNATDSAQALQLASLGQGQANNAYLGLGAQEGQWKMGLLGNLSNAYGVAYDSVLQKYRTDAANQQGLRNAGMQNIYGGINDLSSAVSSGIQYGDSQKYNNEYLNYLKSKQNG